MYAQYIRTHTNHTPGIAEARHIPFPNSVKEKVREKYGKLDSILDGKNLIVIHCHATFPTYRN